ncbi:MAG: radical SAM protein [Bacteroidales bacterium]|nr:radical SAM protein [Bacteroidales bacterium]
MKRVLLINSNTETAPYPVAPLGIALVASSLKSRNEVEIFDFTFNSTDSLISFIKEFKPDYIGIGLRNIDNVTMRNCKWYLEEIRNNIINPVKENFRIPLIIGGSGFSIAPHQIFEYFDVDYGIVGEAEEIFPKLLLEIDSGEGKVELANVITKWGYKVNTSEQNHKPLVLPKANIDELIDFEPYINKGNYPVQTKRGCTHKCIYCSYPNIEGTKYRLRPVEDIVDEIEEAQRRMPDITFEFVDSTFNSPVKHAINICREIIKRKLNVKLRTMGVNPGDVAEELIVVMKQAGFTQIDCTPDSASALMIKKYRKNFSKNKLIQCAEIIKRHDMPVMWFFMLGGPGETEDTIMETFEFIDNNISEKDMVHITEGIRVIPNTELYDIAIDEGVISKEMSVIDPLFYVSPTIGKENLTFILDREIKKRNNVINSVDSEPPAELVQAALKYREENRVEEPMFRSLLTMKNQLKKTECK